MFAITRAGKGKMVEGGRREKASAARLPAGGFNVPLRNFVGPINTGSLAGRKLSALGSRDAD